MTEKNAEEKMVARIREALEESTEQLDPGIRSRLTRMRHDAVAQRRAKRQRRIIWRYAAGALATAAVAGWIFLGPSMQTAQEHALAAMDDMDLLASGESFEIYEEIEFYSWLSDLDHEFENS